MAPSLARSCNRIMATDCRITHQTLETQKLIFRVATNPMRYGLTFKAIEADSGIPYSTLRTYARGEAMMPLTAFIRLASILPNDLMSLLLEPAGKHIEDDDTGDSDHDTAAAHCIDFAAAVARARHPESPGGPEIVESEAADLNKRRGVLRKVAA